MYRVELYSQTTNDYVWRMCELCIIIVMMRLTASTAGMCANRQQAMQSFGL